MRGAFSCAGCHACVCIVSKSRKAEKPKSVGLPALTSNIKHINIRALLIY